MPDIIETLVGHTVNWAFGRAVRKADQVLGLSPPPALAPLPGLPPLSALPSSDAIPAIPALSPSPGLSPLEPGGPSAERPDRDGADDPRDAVSGSYADQIPVGVACLACTRGHLSGLLAAVEAARNASLQGDDQMATRQWALAASEIDAMRAIDWHPDKLAATDPADVTVILAIQDQVEAIRRQIPTPERAGLVLGSAKENKRFALSSPVTDRDRAEIETRIQLIDLHGNALERADLVGRRDRAAAEAAEALRHGRHVLDEAQNTAALYRAETYTRAVEQFEMAAEALTPPPSPEEAEALLAQCQACSQAFYGAYFEAMRTRAKTATVAQ